MHRLGRIIVSGSGIAPATSRDARLWCLVTAPEFGVVPRAGLLDPARPLRRPFGNRRLMGGVPHRFAGGAHAIVVPSAMRRYYLRGAQKLCLQSKIGHQLRAYIAQRLRQPG
jgi:hypothetical protein